MNSQKISTPSLRRTSNNSRLELQTPDKKRIEKHDIESLKIQTQKYDHQKTLIRTKISRMRRIISSRDASIKKVFNQTRDTQSLKTASNSMIAMMKTNLDKLISQKNVLLRELDEYKNSDNFWISNELQIEDKLLFEDQARLQDILDHELAIEQELRNEIQKALTSISEIRYVESETYEFKQSINELLNKCETYDRGIAKTKNAVTLHKIHDKKLSNENAVNEIQKEISDLQMKINVEKLAKKQTDDALNKAIEKLSDIYDEAVAKILKALNSLDQE